MLPTLKIHRISFQRYRDTNPEQQTESASLKAQLAQSPQEIERLRAAVPSSAENSPDCVDCPSGKKPAESLEVFMTGVRMALRCAADKVPQSKEAHLALWREFHGVRDGKPNSRYFDAFRKALDAAPHLKHPDPKEK